MIAVFLRLETNIHHNIRHSVITSTVRPMIEWFDFFFFFFSKVMGLHVRQKARKWRHTCGLSSFEGLAALLTNHWGNADLIFCQGVEVRENHRVLGTIDKHLPQRQQLEDCSKRSHLISGVRGLNYFMCACIYLAVLIWYNGKYKGKKKPFWVVVNLCTQQSEGLC